MKEVIFKRVIIKNFLSIGNDPVEINFNSGIHIITGINLDKADSKNGVGKSTIADAIFFGIFGSTLRSLKKEDITNWINKKECSVTISFNVIDDGKTNEYVSMRSLNPSRVQLIKNGEDVSRTIGKTKEEMYDILGTTPDVFEQCVIMCLNETEPFLSKTPAIKRKFVEDMYKIEIFGRMTKWVRDDFNETKRICETELEKISDLEMNIQLHEKQQREQADRKKIRINELEGRKISVIEEIETLKKKINEIKTIIINNGGEDKVRLLEKIKTIEAKEKEIQITDKEITKTTAINQTTILNLKSKITELERLSDGVCAYCKQPFSESNKQEKRKLIESYRLEIENCEKIIEDNNVRSKAIISAQNKLEDLKSNHLQNCRIIELHENEMIRTESELKSNERMLLQVNKDIEITSSEKNTYIDIISELTARRDVLLTAVEEYKNKLLRLETDKFIISDEGVKNFIIKKMVKRLNNRLNHYLKLLDAPCTCKFNEYFEETIINNRGRECSYFNFSGGERKRIDLAMLFTFMDVRRTQSNISVNIGLYDELLDNALDNVGIEGALNILKERVLNNKEAIYIISHKGEAAKHATGEIIYLEKENDITKRKSYDQFHTNNTIPAS